MFQPYDGIIPVSPSPGVQRRLLAHDETIMLVELTFEAGVKLPPHQHPHSQASYVMRGTIEYYVGDEMFLLHAGDSVTVPPNTPHTSLPLTDALMLDVFTPPREDFL